MRPRMRMTAVAAGLALVAALAVTTGTAAASNAPAPSPKQEPTVQAEYFPGPAAEGRRVQVPATSPYSASAPAASSAARSADAAAATDGAVTVLSQTGPSSARMDVAIIGDGYTADQQADFLADARARWAEVTAVEPYRSYTGLFNVWAVGAVSAQSGISGDPSAGVVKNTALGSYFWCSSTERLICVDLAKVKSYAAKAPAADLVVVVSNSTKYGGAGYSGLGSSYPFAGVSTLSSDNSQSSLIAAHEIGHSIGLLADEYTYDSYGTYTGAEPVEPNSTVRTAAQLTSAQAKWYRWLGESDPSGGTVGTYTGSSYYPLGVYRPTADSLMRSLSTDKFNLPGREAMISGFYRYASSLTAATTATTVSRGQTVTVNVAALAAGLSRLDLRWYVDGTEVTQAKGLTSVVPGQLGVTADGRTHTLMARVTDTTDSLRDPKAKTAATDTLTWSVTS
ncbi:M64 family metallopeptidase [Streptomyces sp. NBC_00102]|uniref:M64 family metallopeptidase n=1 Tax=Streptomyces sp. NBC_00102 TaxID=2975652 RepID=UPI002259F661|nr:M64 family metallopeptidase [Streptomyces sp. NBC_00102]MCX5400917.1 M64 family metallopeptidase [Streptomyces sp. NBC_00102]